MVKWRRPGPWYLEGGEDLAGHIALWTADDLSLRQALFKPAAVRAGLPHGLRFP
jgi:hypothetical protein